MGNCNYCLEITHVNEIENARQQFKNQNSLTMKIINVLFSFITIDQWFPNFFNTRLP